MVAMDTVNGFRHEMGFAEKAGVAALIMFRGTIRWMVALLAAGAFALGLVSAFPCHPLRTHVLLSRCLHFPAFMP